MNIFILDENPQIAAQLHADCHVNKMILESAQMLSTCAAVLLNNGKQIEGLYKSTHVNHPCNLWLRESFHNCDWLVAVAIQLELERVIRFHSTVPHKSSAACQAAYRKLWLTTENSLPFAGLTPFAECVPDWIKALPYDTVTKYQIAYKEKEANGMKMLWSNGVRPSFMDKEF